MKTIELKRTKEKVEVNTKEGVKEVNVDVRTTDLLKTAINNPTKNGYSVSEMRQRIKILDLIDEAEKTEATKLELEDVDFQALSQLVKETRWNVLSRSIIDFSEQFEK